jgi:hypothetical protein
LKKRTKKLLSVAGGAVLAILNRLPAAINKSFLVLFSKKLLFLTLPASP